MKKREYVNDVMKRRVYYKKLKSYSKRSARLRRKGHRAVIQSTGMFDPSIEKINEFVNKTNNPKFGNYFQMSNLLYDIQLDLEEKYYLKWGYYRDKNRRKKWDHFLRMLSVGL